MEVRRVDLANWALRTSPKFTIRVKYQFLEFISSIRDFDQIRDPRIWNYCLISPSGSGDHHSVEASSEMRVSGIPTRESKMSV